MQADSVSIPNLFVGECDFFRFDNSLGFEPHSRRMRSACKWQRSPHTSNQANNVFGYPMLALKPHLRILFDMSLAGAVWF